MHTSGFKHSLVTVVAAAVSAQAPVRIYNCPDITETRALSDLITGLGGTALWDAATGALLVDACTLAEPELDQGVAGRIHGAVYLLPALLGRFGKARVPVTGGCQIGDGPSGRRPADQYVSVFERFGATSEVRPDGTLEVTANRLRGCEIDLLDYTADRQLRSGPLYSGATKMALLTAAVAHGVSVLHNPYPKPDVTDVLDVLCRLGVDVQATATGSIVVHGKGFQALNRPAEHWLPPDLIEVVTWICAGALLGAGPLRIPGQGMARTVAALTPELEVFQQLGVRLETSADEVVVHPVEQLRPVDVTITSPGVFSDSQPFLALLAAHADGLSTITETVWTNRFAYATGLAALGVRCWQEDRRLVLHGPWVPRKENSVVHADDLRGAAALLLAALVAPGVTTITGTGHLARGYHDLPGALSALGADIVTGEAEAASA